MRLLVLNGPNLNLLGTRKPEVYGTRSYAELVQMIEDFASTHDVRVDIMQMNDEGGLIDMLHAADRQYDGIVLNSAAYSHYSLAIRDAVEAITTPVVEVHLSNIAAREPFRRESVVAPVCVGQISGLGFAGYLLAMRYLMEADK